MTLTQIRWLLAAVMAGLVIVGIVATEPLTIGLSSEQANGDYRYAGGTTPAALTFALLTIALYVLLMYAVPTDSQNPLSGVVRRFVAFWLDFVLAMTSVAPIVGIIPTVVEWRRTGAFQWTFERTVAIKGDGLLLSGVLLLTFLALLLYYSFPLVRRRPSPGACLMGYQVLPDGETTLTLKQAILRTLLGFVAVSSAYIAPFVGRDRKQGKFWLDKVFNTRAVMFSD